MSDRPLRVLELYPKADYFTGAAIQLRELTRGLAARGHEVTVATPPGPYGARIAGAGVGHVTLPMRNAWSPSAVWQLARLLRARRIEGEIVVSAEMALRRAPEFGWRPTWELLLYVVHGTLHLCGYDDRTARDRCRMRDRERTILRNWGMAASYATGGGSGGLPVCCECGERTTIRHAREHDGRCRSCARG